jgi:hypothetical protein
VKVLTPFEFGYVNCTWRKRVFAHAIHVTKVFHRLLRARSTHRDFASCALPKHTNSVPAVILNQTPYLYDELAHDVAVLHSA